MGTTDFGRLVGKPKDEIAPSHSVDNANGGNVDVHTTRMPSRSNCISSHSEKVLFSCVGSDKEMKHDGQVGVDGVDIMKLPISRSSAASLIAENRIGRKKRCASGTAKYSTHLQVDHRRRRGKCSVYDAVSGCRRPSGEHLQSSSSSTFARKPEVAEFAHAASLWSLDSGNRGPAVALNGVKLEPVESCFTNGIDHHPAASGTTTEKLASAGRSSIEPPSSAFVCMECGWSFSSRRTLRQHHVLIHTVAKSAALTCGTCGKQFVNGSSLRQHVANRCCSNIPARSCPKCGKTFSRCDTLALHMLLHDKLSLFACDICGRQLSSASKRRRHLLLHDDDATAATRSQCPVCEKWYRDEESVKDHLVSVHDERLASCGICGKTVRGRKRFSNHMLTHSRQYGCTRCGRRFGAKVRLARHMRSDCGSDGNTSGPAGGNHSGKHARVRKPLKLSVKWNCFRSSQRSMLKLDDDETDCTVCTSDVKKKKCGKKLISRTKLLLHFRQLLVKRPHSVCEYCGQTCESSIYLAHHHASCHAEVEAAGRQLVYVENNTRMPSSSVSVMLWKYKFQSVANDDDGTLPFICAVCFQTFTCRRTLRQHVCGSQNLTSYTNDLKQRCGTAVSSSSSSGRHSRSSSFVDDQFSDLSPSPTSVDEAADCDDVGSGYTGAYDPQSRADSKCESPRVDSGDSFTSHVQSHVGDVNRFQVGGEELRETAVEDCGDSVSECEVVPLPDSPSQVLVDGDFDNNDVDVESSTGAIVATPVDDRTLADIVNQIGQDNPGFFVGEDGSLSVNLSREAASTSDDAYWKELHERAEVQSAEDDIGVDSSRDHIGQKQGQQCDESEDTTICKHLSTRSHPRKCYEKLSVATGQCGAAGGGQFFKSVVDDVDFVDVFCKPNVVTAVDSNCSDETRAENGDVDVYSVIHLLESRQYYEDNNGVTSLATDSFLLSTDPDRTGVENGTTRRSRDYDDAGRCEKSFDDVIPGIEAESNDETWAAADAAHVTSLSTSGNVENLLETASSSTSVGKLVTASTSNGHVMDVDDDDVRKEHLSAVGKKARSSKSDMSCDVCGKTFTRKSGLKQHKVTHWPVKPFSCNTCNRQFNRKSSLILHSLAHVDVAANLKSHGKVCTICDRKFTRSSNLSVHMMSVHLAPKPHRCETCGLYFSIRRNLIQHVNVHHKSPTTGEALIASAVPEISNLIVETEKDVLTDIVALFPRKVTDNEPNNPTNAKNDDVDKDETAWISSSGVKLVTASISNGHVTDVDDDDVRKEHLSAVGKKARSSKSDLSCDVRVKTFKGKSGLKQHKVTHWPVKPFSCNACHRQFKYKSSLTEHSLVHGHLAASLESRGTTCTICDRKFTRRSSLYHHIRSIHHAARPHRCETCGLCFSGKKSLIQHVNVHHKSPTTGEALVASTEPEINDDIVEAAKIVPADIVELFPRKVTDNEPNDSTNAENDDVDVATAESNIESCRRKHEDDANNGNISIGCQSRRRRRDGDAESVEDEVTTSFRRQSEWLSKISSSLLRVAEQRTGVECAICGEMFAGVDKLIGHLRIHRPNKRARCEGCRGRFKTEAAYWRHTCWFVVRRCSKWKACCHCDVTFPTSQLLRDHERLVHVTDAAGSDWLQQFETFCERRQESQLKECLCSAGSKRYLCEYCGVRLTTSGRLLQHLTYHALGDDNVIVSSAAAAAAAAAGGGGGGDDRARYQVGCQSSSSFVDSNNSQEVCLSWLSSACVTMWNFKVDYDNARTSLPFFCARCRQQFTDRMFLLSHVCHTFGTSSSAVRHRRGRRKASDGCLIGNDVIFNLGRLLKLSRQRVHREPGGNDSKRHHCKLPACNVVSRPLMVKSVSSVIEKKSAPIPGRDTKFSSASKDGLVEMICIDEEFEQPCNTAPAATGGGSGVAVTCSNQTKIGL